MTIYLMIDGIIGLVASVRAVAAHGHWGALLAEAVLNMLMGLIALFIPGAAVLAFVLLMAAWALISGGLMLAVAMKAFGADAPNATSAVITISGAINGIMQMVIGLINQGLGAAWGYRSCLLWSLLLVGAMALLRWWMKARPYRAATAQQEGLVGE